MKSTGYIPTVLSLKNSFQENIRDTVQENSLEYALGTGASGRAPRGHSRDSMGDLFESYVCILCEPVQEFDSKSRSTHLEILRYMFSQVMKNNIT